jgi:nucleoid-associated protein YgaU
VSASTLAIFQFAGLKASLFAPNSRYMGIGTNTLTTAAGQNVVYLQRRFVPQASAFAVLQQYTVKQGDRLDNTAASLLGDALLYWRICDANGALRPEEMEVPGLTLNITLPQGIPGPTNA